MKVWTKIGVLFVLLFTFGFWGYQIYINTYVPYVPLVSCDEKPGFKEAPQLNTMKHQENIKLLFSYHDVKWKTSNGKIMVQRKTITGFNNRELMWNYTTKANDANYMKDFRKQCQQ